MLSPVPTDFNESSHLLESSIVDGDASFQHSSFTSSSVVVGSVVALSDPVQNRFTVVCHFKSYLSFE